MLDRLLWWVLCCLGGIFTAGWRFVVGIVERGRECAAWMILVCLFVDLLISQGRRSLD